MQNTKISKVFVTTKAQSEQITTKDKNQVIHHHPSIEMLKKMFVQTKNRSDSVPKQQSLLFDRKNSLIALKAYRNRRKVVIDDSIFKGKQFYLDSYLNNNSTIDSPQQISFCVESSKYPFNRNEISQDLYHQIIQKIQMSINSDSFMLPQLASAIPKKGKKFVRSNNENKTLQKYTLPALNETDPQSLKLEIIKAASMTIDQDYHLKQKKSELYRLRNLKNTGTDKPKGGRLLLMKGSLRQSLQNPEISTDKQSSLIQKCSFGTVSQCKLKKQSLPQEKSTILPELKVVKSVKTIASETNFIHKGYMHFHLEAKMFLKQNKQKLNEQAKIKEFLISGITASSYAVIDLQTMTPIATKNFMKKIQIASISKVMTCYLTLLVCKKYRIDYKKCQVRITHQASEMNGTSAELEIGDSLTLEDLLFALMLPSGNDAAVAVAQTMGKIIQRYKTKQTKKSYYETFISHMNMLSRELKLFQQWKNSHGLPLHPNHSTPQAICLLTAAAMMDQKFRDIVSCKEYEVTIKNERTGLKKLCRWKNTNKLLYEGWEGVKTGTTDSAGHCLMAKKGRYLVAVFDSRTIGKRFTECTQLYELAKSKQRYLFPEKWD